MVLDKIVSRNPIQSQPSTKLSVVSFLYKYFFRQVQGYFVKRLLPHTLLPAIHTQISNCFPSILSDKENPTVILPFCHFPVACLHDKLSQLSLFLPFMPVLKLFKIPFSSQSNIPNIVRNAKISICTL